MPTKKAYFDNLEEMFADQDRRRAANPNLNEEQKTFSANYAAQTRLKKQAEVEKLKSGKKKEYDDNYNAYSPDEAVRRYILRQQTMGRRQLDKEKTDALLKDLAQKKASGFDFNYGMTPAAKKAYDAKLLAEHNKKVNDTTARQAIFTKNLSDEIDRKFKEVPVQRTKQAMFSKGGSAKAKGMKKGGLMSGLIAAVGKAAKTGAMGQAVKEGPIAKAMGKSVGPLTGISVKVAQLSPAGKSSKRFGAIGKVLEMAKSKGMGSKLGMAKGGSVKAMAKGGAVVKKTGKAKVMGLATRGGGRALMKGK